MTKTYELVELAKEKNGISSDYGIAKLIGVTSQKISHWKTERSEAKAVELLKLIKAAGLTIDDALKIMSESPAEPSPALSKASDGLYIMLNWLSKKIKAQLLRWAFKFGFKSFCVHLLMTN